MRVNFDQDRKFNIVLYGVEESPLNTSRSKRMQDDLSKCLQVLHNLDEDIQASSIKDYFRLGKFNSANKSKSRPILIKFLYKSLNEEQLEGKSGASSRGNSSSNSVRSSDALNILFKKTNILLPFYIKPDMSPDEKLIEGLLRWHLIQKGTDRKIIKIRGNNLYINSKLHASVRDAKLQTFRSVSRSPLAPNDTASNSTNQHPDQASNVLLNTGDTSPPPLMETQQSSC